MEETKKTVYVIYCERRSEFVATLDRLFPFGFLYRKDRIANAEAAVVRYGWASYLVFYADECKRVILSKHGDEMRLSNYNVINITVDEFIRQNLHKY